MRGTCTRAWPAVAVSAVLALAGCSGPGTPSQDSSPIDGGSGPLGPPSASAAAPRRAADPTPKPRAEPLENCVVDSWRLRTIGSTPGGSVEQVTFSGRGAFDLVFGDHGDWRLVGRPGTPLTATFEVAGFPVTGTAAVDGSARGRYRLMDSVGVFRLESTSGQVDLTWPTGGQTYGMDALAGALVPDGTAALRCTEDRLTLKAANVTLRLTRR